MTDLVRRAAARSSALRRLVNHPLRRRASRLRQAGSLLRPAPRFLVGELRGGTRRYSLASGFTVLVRHRSRDIDLINEIFGVTSAYEPPDALVPELGGPLRILDLGGNIGLFGAFAFGRFAVHEMTSLEPDPENAALLERTIAANQARDRWQLERVAASNAPGRMRFLHGRFADSRRAEADEGGIEVESVDVFSLDHRVDLLKMDIEGGEWTILGDPRLADLEARILVMEWHWRSAPREDAHGAALALLEAAGYDIHLDRVDPPGHTGVIWASRPRARSAAPESSL
jgi:FkbM family methyltransferase